MLRGLRYRSFLFLGVCSLATSIMVTGIPQVNARAMYGTLAVNEKNNKKEPVIERNGDEFIYVLKGSTYADPGARAWDNKGKDLTDKIITTGLPVNTSIAGTYTIRYNLKGSAGKVADEVTRTVKVLNKLPIPDFTDYALNKAAIASSTYQSGFEPSNAVDGNDVTCWRPENSPTAWLQVDLGNTVPFNKAVIREEKINGSYNIQLFTMQYSNDGTTWTDVNTGWGEALGDSKTYMFERIDARYVRLYVAQAKNNNFGIKDLKIFNEYSYMMAEGMYATLLHNTMDVAVGKPAILEPGQEYPSLVIFPHRDGVVTGDVTDEKGNVVCQIPGTALTANQEAIIDIPGVPQSLGNCKVRLKMASEGKNDVYSTFHFTVADLSKLPPDSSKIAYLGSEGKMVYATDYLGNGIMDFSYVGYKGGGVEIPDVPVKVEVYPGEGDAGARIQAAIDQVSAMPLDEKGFRGAVLLKRGRYEIEGTLSIKASGVVLRGEGEGEDGTLIVATGNRERVLITVVGKGGAKEVPNTRVKINELYVPSGARTFSVEDASQFAVGDNVIVLRKGNAEWIHEINMDNIVTRPNNPPGSTDQWAPFDLAFDRVITAVNDNTVTIDAPLGSSVESQWGGGFLYKYTDADRIENVGVENFKSVSEFDKSITSVYDDGTVYYSDKNHARQLVVFDNVKNAWARKLTAEFYAFGLAETGRGSKWVTIEDCKCLEQVSVIVGGNRYPFQLIGQLALVQRCYGYTGRHNFVFGSRVPGPNVFYNCQAEKEYATSEPHHRWSVAGLYDNVTAAVYVQDRAWYGSGHGWSGANYVLWNGTGEICVQQPPTAQNYAIGNIGKVFEGNFPPREFGYFESHGKNVQPRSLYIQQLLERLGPQAVENIRK